MALMESTGHYIVQKTIGHGAFGEALLVKSIFNLNEFYVVKIVDIEAALAKVGRSSKMTEKLRRQLYEEVSVMQPFEHENIVRFYGSFEEANKLHLVLEYCPCGTLTSLIEKRASMIPVRSFREAQIQQWARQLLEATAYMHKNGVIHRDLKCDNIFVADNLGVLKIGDFGFAKKLDIERNLLAQTYAGTCPYMAPEVYQQNESYSVEADIWSLGIVIYEMTMLHLPFDNPSEAIGKPMPPLKAGFSHMLSELLSKRMLVPNAAKRAPASALIKDAYFSNQLTRSSIVLSPRGA